jgi:hypothetical protein
MMRSGNGTMMVLADPIYLGRPDHMALHIDLMTLPESDERIAEERASDIIRKHMRQLCKHWEIVVTDEPYANKDAEVESYVEKYGCEPRRVSLRDKNAHEKASSLTLFINKFHSIPGPIARRIETVLDDCIAAGKPVCVIDSLGIKRYPRR